MRRTAIHLKVIIEHDSHDTPEKLAAEIIRKVEMIYGVRRAELSSYVTEQGE